MPEHAAWQKQLLAIPGPIRGLAIVVALALPGYWWATYGGLYRWLAELQIAWFDGYEVVLTGLVCVVLTLLPTMLVLVAISKRLPAPSDGPRFTSAQAEAFLRRNYGRLVVGGISACLLSFGLFQLVNFALIGDLTRVDLPALEAGHPPPSRHVRVDGAPAWQMSAGVEGEGRASRAPGQARRRRARARAPLHEATFYVPLRSKPGAPAALVLEVAGSQLEFSGVTRSQRHFEGTLSGSLPGIAQTVFREKGVALTDPFWVLDVDHKPRETRDMGAAFTTMGGVGTVLLAGWIVFRRRRERARG